MQIRNVLHSSSCRGKLAEGNEQWKVSLNHPVLIVLASVAFMRHVRQVDQAHPPEIRSHGQINYRFALLVVNSFVGSNCIQCRRENTTP
jgi:hypothetical protein